MLRSICFYVILTALILTVNTYAAEPVKQSPPVGQVARSNEPNKPLEEVLPGPDEVLLVMGGREIKLEQIKWLDPGVTPQNLPKIKEFLSGTQLLYEEALRQGLEKDPRIQFMAELHQKQTIANELVKSVRNKVVITDEDVKKYYDENQEKDPALKSPEYLSFSHITTKTQAEANDVLAKLKAGADINELAKTASISPDNTKGGVCRKFMSNTVVSRFGDEFLKALTASGEGEFFGPVKSRRDEWEVGRHEGRVAPKVVEFDQIKENLRTRLLQMEQSKALEKFIADLKNKQAEQNAVKGEKAEKTKSEKTKDKKTGHKKKK